VFAPDPAPIVILDRPRRIPGIGPRLALEGWKRAEKASLWPIGCRCGGRTRLQFDGLEGGYTA